MTKFVYRLLPGHPPLDELKQRFTMSRVSVPQKSSGEDPEYPKYIGYEGVTNLLEALQYDADNLRDGSYDPTELFDGSDNETWTWELVDKDGKVWTECNEIATEEDL